MSSFSLEKEKAVSLLGSGVKWTDVKLSKKLGVSRATVQKWKNDKEFRQAVVSEFERVCKQDQLYRVKEIRKVLKPIYKEIRKRVKNGNLKDMPFKDLIFTLSKLQSELRNDLERLNLINSKSASSKGNGSGDESATTDGVLSNLTDLYMNNRKGNQNYLQ